MANLLANPVQSGTEQARPKQDPSYVQAAFSEQHNVILMIGAGAFALSFASFVPVVVGFVAELLWLTVAPRLASFRRWVDRGRRREREARADAAILKVLGDLPATHTERSALFTQTCELLLRALRGTLDEASHELAQSSLFRLRWAFLEYQLIDVRLIQTLSRAPRPALEQEIDQITLSLQGEKDWGRRVAGNRALMLAKGRLSQLAELEAIQRTCELRLEAFEKSLEHLKSQAETPEAGQQLAANIEALLSQFGSTRSLDTALTQALSS
jgi:hypothetical protein